MKNANGSKSALTKKTPTLVEVRCAHEGCEETTVMPFSRAAKGTHRCPEHSKQPGTPATGAPPEVTLDSGTVAVLPNPADAPPYKPAGRKKKPMPTVAEVPDWAKRAAARDTAAEMATVPETAPTPEATPEPPVAKKGRAAEVPKTNPAKVADGAAQPGSLRAVGEGWLASLRAAGHTKSTLSSYTKDIEVAYEFLGADVAAGGINEKQIAAFNTSKGVLRKKNGKAKAQPTILKTRRALRLALTWAEQKGLIKKAPFAAKTPA